MGLRKGARKRPPHPRPDENAIRPHHSGKRGSGCLDSCLSGSPDRELRMGWSVNIGSIAGTAIRIHYTLLLFLAWIFLASLFSVGLGPALNGLAFMLLLFACVLAHEFGHIFTARAFGVPTP